MPLTSGQFVAWMVALMGLLYLLYALCRQSLHQRAEYFQPDGSTDASTPAQPIEYDVQRALTFSDLTVSPEQREQMDALREQADQIKTVDERFQAAKRKVEEHGLRPGVMPQKRRRELVEALNRRPACGRRTRSWRTEFSDNIRGDPRPKNVTNNLGIMRIGRSDPSVDLHPGALGPMSGRAGLWISEENVPENVVDEMEA